MHVVLRAFSGRELAALDARPDWRLQDVLMAIPECVEAQLCRMCVFFKQTELVGHATLSEVGVGDGDELKVVFESLPRILRYLAATGSRGEMLNKRARLLRLKVSSYASHATSSRS